MTNTQRDASRKLSGDSAGWVHFVGAVVAVSLFAANAEAQRLPAPTNSWQIDETQGFDNKINDFSNQLTIGGSDIFYTVTNGHPTESINAFVVGFHGMIGYYSPIPNISNAITASSYLLQNAPGWTGATLNKETWGSPQPALGGQSAEAFFGMTWSEFQAFDDKPTTDAVAFYRNGGADLLPPGAVDIGATSYPSLSEPLFGVTSGTAHSPAVVMLSGGGVSGGGAGVSNSFSVGLPEPSTFVLAALGLMGLGLRRRRRRA